MILKYCPIGFHRCALPVRRSRSRRPADKPTVGKYLADGYTVQRAEIGNPFLQFILQKPTASGQILVWCSVQVQTGETSSCRTIK